MRSLRKRISAGASAQGIVLFACCAFLVACNGGDTDGGGAKATGSTSADALQGAGSTLIDPIMEQWVQEYKKNGGTDINYQAIGSGGGIKNLINKTVSFAGSDAPMNDEETKDAKDPVLHFPAVIGAAAIAYNVDGVPTGLHLSGPVLADIFLGTITKWNDPKIVALNPTANLPDLDISVIHRSDASGTTYIFTDYLSQVSPDWKAKVGTGKSVDWPVGTGGKGSSGVAGLLQNHKGSVAYLELAHAVQNKIPYAAVQNSSGAFIDPSSDSASAAADGAKIPDDMKVSIVNSPNPKAYPIAGFSYLIVFETSDRGADLNKFLKYALTDGQSLCKGLFYGPIPDSLDKRELKMLDSVK